MSKNNATNNIFLNQPLVQTATNYTALATDVIIEVTSTAAIRTITLPAPSAAASTSNVGKFYVIKDTSGGAATNNIFVVPASGTIDGSGSLVIGTNYGAVQVYTDGTNYYSQAFVIAPATGVPLARGSWTQFINGGFVPGATVPLVPNFSIVGPSASRLDLTGATQIIPPVNMTVAAQNITIIRSGLYEIEFSTGMTFGSATLANAQAVKNGTLVCASTATVNFGSVQTSSFSCLQNLVSGDVIDLRVGCRDGNGTFFYFVYSILQVPTTF